MKTLLITGGCGFIGSNFILWALGKGWDQLRKQGVDQLVNLDKLSYAGNASNLKQFDNDPRYILVHGDIGDKKICQTLLEKYEVLRIINFAAESHVDRSIESPEVFFENNLMATVRFLETSRVYYESLCKNQAAEFRFLHVSTDEVYGSLQPDDPSFVESTAYSPNSPYAASKACSDFAVRSYFHTFNFPVLTTNCSNNYGPMQFPEKLIPLMILNAVEGLDLPIYGSGKNVRDWLFVTDHCLGIVEVLAEGKLGETYNIGGMNELSNIAVVNTVCEILNELKPRKDGLSYTEQITYVKDRPGHDFRYSVNCNKIQRDLNWKPKEDFKAGLKKTIEWYLSNTEWCQEITMKKYKRNRIGLT